MRSPVLPLLLLTLSLAACSPAPAAPPAPPTPAPQPPVVPLTVPPTTAPAPPVTPAPTAAPTAVFERVTQPEPKVAAAEPQGLATFRDDTSASDALLVSTEDLPLPATGEAYRAWLSDGDRTQLVGTLKPGRGGALTVEFSSSDHLNLLKVFDRVTVGRGEPGNPVLVGSLPPQALEHVRHLLVETPATPNGTGLLLGLRQQTNELLRHSQFLNDALEERNLTLEKLHAEHLVNLIEGAYGQHSADLNGNGQIDNPGDGFGLLENEPQPGYLAGVRERARLAAEAPDATHGIKLHAGHVDIAAENTDERVTEIDQRALAVLATRSAAATDGDVRRILALAQHTIQGVDLNGDEQIAPVPGEGGVLVAYQHAQLMAGIPLARASSTVAAAAPTGATTAQVVVPTSVPTRAAPTPSRVQVAIGDDTFTPQVLKIPAGATVVWTQSGRRPHTVTADDGSFDSHVLNTGDTFEQTFPQPGTVLYYCDLHGGPNTIGMAARLEVERTN